MDHGSINAPVGVIAHGSTGMKCLPTFPQDLCSLGDSFYFCAFGARYLSADIRGSVGIVLDRG
ncbi:MAG: hypothetical protein MUF20_14180, partial [Methylotetracoccus sp.]|nr:hypothetical protein [Methylotetracoccus sp.]